MQVSDKVLTAIGLMSSPLVDGVRAAVMRTDGLGEIEQGPSVFYPYPRETKVNIRRAIKAAREGLDEAESIAKALDDVTTAHIKASLRLMEKAYLTRDEVDVIGMHGHSILHKPSPSKDVIGRSWQIGSASIVATELRIDVVSEFRQEDIERGGRGMPLMPVYIAGLVAKLDRDKSICVLNISDKAEVTYVPASCRPEEMVSFDAGPGSNLVDEWVHFHTGEIDDLGKTAALGTVDEEAVKLMALNPYFRRSAPKYLDGYDFKMKAIEHLSVEDGAATLTALAAEALEKASEVLPDAPEGWIVCGSGRHNDIFMKELEARMEAPFVTAEEAGWQSDDLHAQAMAYLAVRSLKKLPITYPKTTKAPHPLTGGVYSRAPV